MDHRARICLLASPVVVLLVLLVQDTNDTAVVVAVVAMDLHRKQARSCPAPTADYSSPQPPERGCTVPQGDHLSIILPDTTLHRGETLPNHHHIDRPTITPMPTTLIPADKVVPPAHPLLQYYTQLVSTIRMRATRCPDRCLRIIPRIAA